MKLKDLIEKTEWENIKNHLENIDECDKNLSGYEDVLKFLKLLPPKKVPTTIHIRHIVDDYGDGDVSEYEDVYGMEPEDEQTWALDFSPWEEWLGMDLDQGSLEEYGEDVFVSRCIWEMTYHGYTPQDVQEKLDKLAKQVEKTKERLKNGKLKDATLQ